MNNNIANKMIDDILKNMSDKYIQEKIFNGLKRKIDEKPKDKYTINENTIIFENFFNKPIDNFVFPESVTKIIFGMMFDQQVDNLPTITFGNGSRFA